jgi:hypothetical protein
MRTFFSIQDYNRLFANFARPISETKDRINTKIDSIVYKQNWGYSKM